MTHSALSRFDNLSPPTPPRVFLQVCAAAHDGSQPAVIEVGTLIGVTARDLRIHFSQPLKLGTIHDIAIETEADAEPVFLSCEVSSRTRSIDSKGWLLRLHILNASDTDLQRWDKIISNFPSEINDSANV